MTLSVKIDWAKDGDYTDYGDDVTGDVRRAEGGITVSYGRDQHTALSPTASGRGSLTLNNHSRRYTPRNTASILYGKLKPARPVKITRTIGTTEYVLFIGHTDDSPLNPDLNSQNVAVSLVDSLADFRSQTITTAVHQGIRTGAAIGAILDACNWPAGLRDLDAGGTVIPYWWENSTDAAEALEKVVRSEGGPAFLTVGSDGSIMFRDRHHRLIRDESLTSQGTWYSAGGGKPVINGLTYDDAWANIINTVTVEVTERRIQEPETVWTSDTDITVASGETTIVTASGSDPVIRAITPKSDTDYTLMSGTATITLLRTSGASIPIQIAATSTAVIRGLQLRAQPIQTARTIQVEGKDGSSITDYGQRGLPHDLPWCNRYDAKAVIDAVIAERAHPRPVLTVRFMIGRDTTRAAQLLSRNLADRVTVHVDELGLDDDFYIESISHELTGEHDHTIIFGLEMAPPEVTNPFRFGSSQFGTGQFGSSVTDPDTIFRFGVNTSGFRFGEGRFAR